MGLPVATADVQCRVGTRKGVGARDVAKRAPHTHVALSGALRNLKEDPSESKNYAEQQSEIVQELQQLYFSWVADLPVSKSNIPSPTEWAEPPKAK